MKPNKTSQATFRWRTVDPTIRPEDVDAICLKYEKMEKALIEAKGFIERNWQLPDLEEFTVPQQIDEAIAFDPLAETNE